MHPALLFGAVAFVGWLIDEHRAAIRRAAEAETARVRAADKARARVKTRTRATVARLSARAIGRLLRTLKDERRTAARARDALAWGSRERDAAHGLVVTLAERIDALYAQKAAVVGGEGQRAAAHGAGKSGRSRKERR